MAAGSGASVQQCEEYITHHGIQLILKECIVKICKDRPGNPYKWMREYFDKLERVRLAVLGYLLLSLLKMLAHSVVLTCHVVMMYCCLKVQLLTNFWSLGALGSLSSGK